MSATDLAKYGMRAELPQVFDHQVTGTFQECERMAYYRHILGRQTKGDNFTLRWGSVFHSATEIWHETKSPEAVVQVIDSGIPDVVEDRYGRDRGRMNMLFAEWVKYNMQNPLKFLRTEQMVQVACYDGEGCPYYTNGCGLTYGGRMDRIVEWNGIVGPLDYKTTVMDESDPVGAYRPNHQMEGYVWAASHLMGKHCWGIIVEQVICNKSKIKIHRFPVSFARDAIREWVDNEKVLQSRIRHLYETSANDETNWRQNHGRCWKPYRCHFRDVCLSSREGGLRYRWMRDNTTEQRWDFNNIPPITADESEG